MYLGTGAITALLEMLRYERITFQRRPTCDNAARCNSCPELGGDVLGPLGVSAVYQGLSWLACMVAHVAPPLCIALTCNGLSICHAWLNMWPKPPEFHPKPVSSNTREPVECFHRS